MKTDHIKCTPQCPRESTFKLLNVLSQSREEITVSNTYMYRRCLECQVTKISINMFN